MAKKGSSLVCVPCGREILITESGSVYSELWCCGVVMGPAAKKAVTKKAPAARKKAGGKKKAPAGKTSAAKGASKKARAGKTAKKKQ